MTNKRNEQWVLAVLSQMSRDYTATRKKSMTKSEGRKVLDLALSTYAKEDPETTKQIRALLAAQKRKLPKYDEQGHAIVGRAIQAFKDYPDDPVVGLVHLINKFEHSTYVPGGADNRARLMDTLWYIVECLQAPFGEVRDKHAA